MRDVGFAVCISVSLIVEHLALRLAYGEATGKRWQPVSVFLAGGMLAGVFAAISAVISGVSGAYGLVLFVVLLAVDVRLLIAHERAAGRDNSSI